MTQELLRLQKKKREGGGVPHVVIPVPSHWRGQPGARRPTDSGSGCSPSHPDWKVTRYLDYYGIRVS